MALIKWTLVDWHGTKSNNATDFERLAFDRISSGSDEIYVAHSN